MAIANIQIGRVESDPMAVPMAASMRRQQGERFDRLLQAADAAESTPSTDVPDAADEKSPEELASATSAEHDVARPDQTETEEPQPVDDDVAETATGPAVEDGDATDSIRRAGADQQKATAGKGTDSPRHSVQDGEPLLAARLQAQPTAQTTPLAPATQPPTQSLAPARSDALIRGAAGTAEVAASTPGSRRVQAGYATRSAQSAQLLEQARDSVFKQILMKLNNDGGEVRMRLQPPDLGELDLRMTVENGNKLTLLIAAERQDMTQLLQRHLNELKQTLQASGLDIAGAEVQTRSEFERGQHQRAPSGDDAEPNDFQDGAVSSKHPRGYVTAEGLDFWA